MFSPLLYQLSYLAIHLALSSGPKTDFQSLPTLSLRDPATLAKQGSRCKQRSYGKSRWALKRAGY